MENKREMVRAALCDIECLDSELQDIAHLLCLLDEGLTDALEPIQRGETYGGVYLLDRWPMHLSMLNVIRYRVADILSDLQECVKKGHEAIGTWT